MPKDIDAQHEAFLARLRADRAKAQEKQQAQEQRANERSAQPGLRERMQAKLAELRGDGQREQRSASPPSPTAGKAAPDRATKAPEPAKQREPER